MCKQMDYSHSPIMSYILLVINAGGFCFAGARTEMSIKGKVARDPRSCTENETSTEDEATSISLI